MPRVPATRLYLHPADYFSVCVRVRARTRGAPLPHVCVRLGEPSETPRALSSMTQLSFNHRGGEELSHDPPGADSAVSVDAVCVFLRCHWQDAIKVRRLSRHVSGRPVFLFLLGGLIPPPMQLSTSSH